MANRLYLSDSVSVDVLEDLVQPKLEQPLHGVAEECRCPSLRKFPHTGLFNGHLEAVDDVTILLRIHLYTTLDQIERHHSGVSDATAEDTTETTQLVVFE